jgi:hypothetical protein
MNIDRHIAPRVTTLRFASVISPASPSGSDHMLASGECRTLPDSITTTFGTRSLSNGIGWKRSR